MLFLYYGSGEVAVVDGANPIPRSACYGDLRQW